MNRALVGLTLTALVGLIGCGVEAQVEAATDTTQLEQGALVSTDPLLGSWRSSGGWVVRIDECGCGYLTVTQDQRCTPVGMQLYNGLALAPDGNYYGSRSLGPCNNNQWVRVKIVLSADKRSYVEYPDLRQPVTFTKL